VTRAWLAVACTAALACGSGVTPSPVPSPAATREGRWAQDVEYLAAELPRLHPNLFFRTPRAEFDRVVDEVRRAMPAATDAEAIVGLMRVAAVPGDPHTAVYAWEEFPKLPVRFTRLAGGLFVTQAEAAYTGLLGSRVLAFDGSAVEDVEAAVATVISHDNTAWLRHLLPRFLVLPEVLRALRLTSDPGGVTLLLEDATGARFTAVLRGSRPAGPLIDVTTAAGASLPLARQRNQEHYWFTVDDGSRTLYLQYNHCQNAAEDLESVARRAFQQLEQGRADRLVVDVRWNEGGDSRVDDALVSGVRDRAAWRARGRLFVIVGGATFSSGLWTADDLRRLGAVVAGEPTGGRPNHYGDVRTFGLPNCRLQVGYSTRFFRLVEGADPPSLVPDLLVEPTIDDLRAGRDPVLEAVIRYR
jgi:hypothetical protein